MRVNFGEVKLYAWKSVKCAGGCGRTLKRQRKFYQTLNPFNKTAQGVVKDADDIYSELRKDIEKWRKESVTCIHCAEKGG